MIRRLKLAHIDTRRHQPPMSNEGNGRENAANVVPGFGPGQGQNPDSNAPIAGIQRDRQMPHGNAPDGTGIGQDAQIRVLPTLDELDELQNAGAPAFANNGGERSPLQPQPRDQPPAQPQAAAAPAQPQAAAAPAQPQAAATDQQARYGGPPLPPRERINSASPSHQSPRRNSQQSPARQATMQNMPGTRPSTPRPPANRSYSHASQIGLQAPIQPPAARPKEIPQQAANDLPLHDVRVYHSRHESPANPTNESQHVPQKKDAHHHYRLQSPPQGRRSLRDEFERHKLPALPIHGNDKFNVSNGQAKFAQDNDRMSKMEESLASIMDMLHMQNSKKTDEVQCMELVKLDSSKLADDSNARSRRKKRRKQVKMEEDSSFSDGDSGQDTEGQSDSAVSDCFSISKALFRKPSIDVAKFEGDT